MAKVYPKDWCRLASQYLGSSKDGAVTTKDYRHVNFFAFVFNKVTGIID
jgi:hypothetical protein